MKILSDLAQFVYSPTYCKCAVCEKLLKGSRINWSNLCLENIFLTLNKLQQLYIWTWLSSNENDKILFTHCLDSNSQSTQCKSIEDALHILRKHEMEYTVRVSVWSSPKGFGDSGKHNYSTKLKMYFVKNSNTNNAVFSK